MKNNKGIIVGIIVVILAVGVAIALTGKKSDNMSSTTKNSDSSSMSSSSDQNSGSVKDAVATDSVDIKDYAFSPKTITVKVGTKVTWTNQDAVKHNIVSDNKGDGAPDGPLLNKGESYSFTFTKAGTYTYHCMPHPYMHGIVVVTE